MSDHPSTDIQSMVKQVYACGSQDATAGGVPELVTASASGTNDGVQMTGETIDLLNYSSVSLATNVISQLTDTKTVSLTVNYETSVLGDGSDWSGDIALRAITVVSTGTSVKTEFVAVQEDGLKVRSLPRYIRFNTTLTFSATSADIGFASSVATLGGSNQLPAS